MKICFVASSGGHLEQIMKLNDLMERYNGFIITEKTQYSAHSDIKTYFINQVNRENLKDMIKMFKIFIDTFRILKRENPDIIISTGALSTIPACVLGKLMKRKIVFIESFAKIEKPSLTGKLVYKFADLFIIQWESLKKYYPNAVFKGGIY